MPIALDAVPGGLRVSTPFDAAFLTEFKAKIPHGARTWQKPYWVVDPQYGPAVAGMIKTYFGVQLIVPQAAVATVEVRTFEVQYLGRCKQRTFGEPPTAYGTTDGQSWTLVFPEDVLKMWFGGIAEQQTIHDSTFYGILGIPQIADPNAVKQAYRRMARQWHPDVCREADATQRFQAIQKAYVVLSDPMQRRKYDAGLMLETSTTRAPTRVIEQEYRAPLRCGQVLVEGQNRVGRFLITRIIAWEDVVRNGKTMVSSWDMEAEGVRIEWV